MINPDHDLAVAFVNVWNLEGLLTEEDICRLLPLLRIDGTLIEWLAVKEDLTLIDSFEIIIPVPNRSQNENTEVEPLALVVHQARAMNLLRGFPGYSCRVPPNSTHPQSIRVHNIAGRLGEMTFMAHWYFGYNIDGVGGNCFQH